MPSQKIRGYAIWVLCALFFLYEFFLRTVMGTFQTPIMHDLSITSIQFATLSSSAYLLIYGFMQIPVGILIDRYGLKACLFMGSLSCALSCVGLSYAHSYEIALAYRVLMGFGSSFGFICVLFSVYKAFPPKYAALFIGISQFIGTLGPIAAAGPIGSYMTHNATIWRELFSLLSGIGVLFMFLSILVIKNIPEQRARYILLKRPHSMKLYSLKSLLRKEPWFIALFSAFSYFSIEYLAETEGITLLMSKGLSHTSAASLISISWIGYGIGCPIAGFVSDFFRFRKPIMVILALSGFMGLSLMGILSKPILLSVLFFLLGLGASAQSIGFARMGEEFKKDLLGLGLGLNNALITGFIAIGAPIIGHVALTFTTREHFFLLSFIALIGLILPTFFIRESFCKSQRDMTFLNA